MVLASFSKFGNLGQAGFGDLVHALPAQNGTWVRYATAINKVEFDRIIADQLYLRSNLPAAGLTFSVGALDVKSSWIDMTNIPHPERYYTRKAWLKDSVARAAARTSEQRSQSWRCHFNRAQPNGRNRKATNRN